MAATQPGILAIWHDCRAGRDDDLEAWFQGEHLIERLAVPGFRYGRRHKAVSGGAGYFNFYVVDAPAVLVSKPYLARLDDPTPMTRTIMSEVFLNMSRTVCRRTVRRGAFRGAFAVTARFNDAPDMSALAAQVDALVQDTRIAAGEIWSAVDAAGQPVSMEEKLRGGDRKIQAALMIDTLYQADAERLGEQLASSFSGTDIGVFRVLCHIGRGDL
jgi:hypothetical protein